MGTRSSGVALFFVALASFALQSVFLPVYAGRDMSRYIQSFLQLWYEQPVLPSVMDTRGPLASLGVGIPLEIGGAAADVWMALLYAASIVGWGAVALVFGRRAALLTSAVLLVNPGYAILFHELASDALFAAAFAGWAVLLSRAILRPSVTAFLLAGLGMGVLVLVRPANQVLIVFALLPLVLRAPWGRRFAWGAAFFVSSAIVTQGWKAISEVRYGDAVALHPSSAVLVAAFLLLPLLFPPPWRRRLAIGAALGVVAVVGVKGWKLENPVHYVRAAAQLPSSDIFLFRAYADARIMAPDNGPASRELARVVRRDLLTQEPYRSYGVEVGTVFSSGSNRVLGDLGHLQGVDLGAVTREAILEHPGPFVRSAARTMWQEIWTTRMYAPLTVARGGERAAAGERRTSEYVVVNGRRLPRPSGGEPVPSSRFAPDIYTLHGQAREVWKSPTDHPLVFDSARDERRYEKFGQDTGRLANRIPTHDGSPTFVHRLNQASRAFPPPVVWLAVGLVALALRRPRRAFVSLALAAGALIVIVATSLLVTAQPEYAAPVSPAFVVLAAAGLVGAHPRVRSRVRWHPPVRTAALVRLLSGAALGVAAAVWAVEKYAPSLDGVPGGEAPHDLSVFLRAAAAVFDGVSPYVYRADETFAYPPLLGVLVAPLEPLAAGTATAVWAVASLAAIVGALLLLGVRDWRCHALALVYVPTQSAVHLGTVGPLLLLGIAAAWRWRDRIVAPAAAAGAAVALKLLVWPVAVWLALTMRTRAALATAGFAVAFALVPWAAIGFAGLGEYPGLLRRLADEEASASYSVVALGVRAHLPESAAFVISLLVTAALLVVAARFARDERRSNRDRDVGTLTLALAAALAASPIVWVHYFLLLVVPLALTRPRLSPLWLVPLAYWPLGETAWPGGDARKLGLALATTLLLVLVPLTPRGTWSRLCTAVAARAPRGPVAARPTRAR